MSIRTEFGFADPDSVACTLQVTMTLKEWKALRAVLDANMNDTIYYFKASISNVVEQAEKRFWKYESVLQKE